MDWLLRKPKLQPDKNDTVEEMIGKIRGIKDVDRFLNPTKDELFDPYLMKNIQEASNRIVKAIHKGENIVVSYDPDADGITANTIMLRYLGNYTDKLDYIYGERNDGHGIAEQLKIKGLNEEKDVERIARSKANLEKIKNCDLLILIDSSSNDADTCEAIINTFGCDIIVLDHHEIERDNPHVILVNPQQEGCEYPNKQLSGAGVVFKTIEVIEDNFGQVDIWQYIDLVAVGMYADIMSVDVLENRYLIMHGLRNMKNTGLIRILKGAKADMMKLNCDSIGFSIAPLINGVARMDNIKLAIDLLLEDDDSKCKPIRLKMQKLNDERKIKQKEILDNYLTRVDSSQKVLVVLDEQSSKGFNGIIAQQLSEIYKRPVIVGRIHNGNVAGSFRGYDGFDMKTFLAESNLLQEAIGHPSAGGFSVEENKLEELLEYIENNLPELKKKEPFVLYDFEIDANESAEYIKVCENFNLLAGKGFPKVIIRINNISIEEPQVIGKTEETVKIKTLDTLELIRFKVNKDYASELGFFDVIDVVGTLSMNEFFNFKLRQKVCTPQVILQDYKLSS